MPPHSSVMIIESKKGSRPNALILACWPSGLPSVIIPVFFVSFFLVFVIKSLYKDLGEKCNDKKYNI